MLLTSLLHNSFSARASIRHTSSIIQIKWTLKYIVAYTITTTDARKWFESSFEKPKIQSFFVMKKANGIVTCSLQKLDHFVFILAIALTNVIAPLELCVMPGMDWQRQTCITAALLYILGFS